VEFRDLLRRRRMVRSFTDAPVAAEAIDRIVDAARRGPSAGYSQGVEFIVITDPDARRAAGAFGFDPNRPPQGAPRFLLQAPVIVVICTSANVYRERYREPDKARALAGGSEDDFWRIPYWQVDAGAAMMLLLLAAVDEGVGAGVAGVMGQAHQEYLRSTLSIPATYEAVALVALGHPAADAGAHRGSAATRPRRARRDVVHRDRW
jgi:nitroreductase